MLQARVVIQLVVALLLVAFVVLPASADAASLAPASKQQLRVNIGAIPSTLDPGAASYEHELVVANALFAPLYRSRNGVSGRLVPFLASGQPKVSRGGKRVTIKLRAARWSDGRAITAADVQLAATRAKRNSYLWGFFGNATVRAVGTRTVRIDFRRAVPWRNHLLTMPVLSPVPSHVIRRVGAKWTQPRYLVSSGPFRYEDVRGRTELTLVRNQRWWGAKRVKLNRLVLRAIPVASATSMFRGGRLDASILNTSVHASALSTWKADKQRRYQTVASNQTQLLYLNTRAGSPLANPAVRRGIALALDRAAIAGVPSASGTPLNRILPTGVEGAHSINADAPLLSVDGAPDQQRARQELAAGGGVTATLNLFYSSSSGTGDAIASRIRTQLGAVGVRVTLRPTPVDTLARRGYGISPTRDDVHMLLQGWIADYPDPANFHQLFTCANIEAGLNTANYCDPTYDAQYAEAIRNRPFPERTTAHRALEQHLTGPAGAMPAVPLYEPRADYLVQPWVRGYRVLPNGLANFETAALLTR